MLVPALRWSHQRLPAQELLLVRLVGVRALVVPKNLLPLRAFHQAVAPTIPLRLPTAVAGAAVVPGAALDLLLPLLRAVAAVAGTAAAARSHTPTTTPTTLHLVVVVAAVAGAVAVEAVVVEGAVVTMTQTLRRRSV